MSYAVAQSNQLLFQNYKTGSGTGSVTLTRHPTRPSQNRWPGEPWLENPVTALLQVQGSGQELDIQSSRTGKLHHSLRFTDIWAYKHSCNRKMSYRKQTARQRSCRENFSSGNGPWSTL